MSMCPSCKMFTAKAPLNARWWGYNPQERTPASQPTCKLPSCIRLSNVGVRTQEQMFRSSRTLLTSLRYFMASESNECPLVTPLSGILTGKKRVLNADHKPYKALNKRVTSSRCKPLAPATRRYRKVPCSKCPRPFNCEITGAVHNSGV